MSKRHVFKQDSFKKNRFKQILIALSTGIFGLVFSALATAAGLMKPVTSGHPDLSIKEHHVQVIIEDGYAVTSVEQIFHNPGNQELEAIYSFPVPEKASVGEFTYWIDDKAVTGEVLEKKQAREIYQNEKAQGRETALVEKDEYRVFEASVFPVRANQDVRVRLVYIQTAKVDTGIGRYVYPLEEGGVDEQKAAFWSYNEVVTEAFSFQLDLRSSYPIDGIRLPKHPGAQVNALSENHWRVSMSSVAAIAEEGVAAQPASQFAQALDKDVVLYWRHKKGLPGSIDMVSYREPGKDKGTFMMTLTPGDDLAPLAKGRDWVFVLDFSGSMKGKYQSLIAGVNKGLSQLNAADRFRIILFNNSSREITAGYTIATAENVSQYTTQLESLRPEGGTNLYAGLQDGIAGLDADRASAIVLVTDGVANVGVTEKKDFLDLLKARDVRLFTFVMGNSANRPLLDGMAKISNGFAMSVSNSDDISGRLLLATDKLTHEALRDVELSVKGVKVTDLTPAQPGSLYYGQQLVVFGHYRGEGLAQVVLHGKISGEKKSWATEFEFPREGKLHPEIERLWAYATIEQLQNEIDYLGETADTKQALVDVALEYGLVTNYTSMLVVRDEVYKQLNISRNNQQRVARESIAREQRQQQPVRNNRQDVSQPAFSKPRSYPKGGSGGGAFGPWMLIILLPGGLLCRKSSR